MPSNVCNNMRDAYMLKFCAIVILLAICIAAAQGNAWFEDEKTVPASRRATKRVLTGTFLRLVRRGANLLVWPSRGREVARPLNGQPAYSRGSHVVARPPYCLAAARRL